MLLCELEVMKQWHDVSESRMYDGYWLLGNSDKPHRLARLALPLVYLFLEDQLGCTFCHFAQ
jgi:hypothetical protein